MKNIQTIILCGGKGYRLKEETEFKPKPMIEIGGKPILWHIMKIYSHYGFNDFIICLGYKGNLIKEFFHHQYLYSSNLSNTLLVFCVMEYNRYLSSPGFSHLAYPSFSRSIRTLLIEDLCLFSSLLIIVAVFALSLMTYITFFLTPPLRKYATSSIT